MTTPPAPDDFYRQLGIYHAVWQSLDVLIDYAIGSLQKLSPPETMDLVKGMHFGKKLRLFKELAATSDHPNKIELEAEAATLLNSKRTVITHGYLATEPSFVKFTYLGNKNGAKPETRKFDKLEFEEHVLQFVKSANRLQVALDYKNDDVDEFGTTLDQLIESQAV